MRLLIGIAAIAIVVAASVARVVIARTTEKQLLENDRLAQAIVPLKNETREVDALRGLIQDFLARKRIIETMTSHSAPAAETLAELSRLPRTIVLTHVRIDGLRLFATGHASGEKEANEMIAALGKSRFIGSPQIRKLDPPGQRRDFGSNRRAFEIEMDLRP